MSSTPNRNVTRRSSHSAGSGAAPLRATANAYAPGAGQHLQSLHESSEQDSSRSQVQHGAIAAPIGQGHASGIEALLATGPVAVYMTAERERPNANPHKPAFLHGVVLDSNNPDQWTNVVLPYVAGLTFNVACPPDVHFAGVMFGSPSLPGLYTAVTKLELPGFHWFSGIANNRLHNPNLEMAKNLPNLRELTFRMHTAGITKSAFGSEREMIECEKLDPVRSKDRKCMPYADVAAKYDLGALFACRSLTHVRIEYIDSDMTANATKDQDPVNVLYDIRGWLGHGFAQQGQNVVVDLVRVA
ncbi:uncharacterized protein K460DRAFT_415240 [Cucurbitaria berberidis CBS 394.84]|uniref:Uncharacterized protein n=1 Tax=Cucurbitaria berberidis CBS 394.84 TaxID=1168544 RepID=A0A9P4GP28_9PLEO|nr:uncharacterized protein K460DRAFT_415240 [Cucurbitaria berberidis CBS 394.84]KAF1848739.1 hypothetical protein K460DRAFT_415240 [Cucurbitaria berberidis CBS 394.84]